MRNFRSQKQAHHIEFHPPPGIIVEPRVLEGKLAPGARGVFPIRVKAGKDLSPGVRIVALDVTLDGRRFGELFDFTAGVAQP